METQLLQAFKYALSPYSYRRIPSQEVSIGELPLGGSNPIRIQSMTTTDTMDTLATVEQSIRMVEAGCDYVRITAPSKKEAENLAEIKKALRRRGYTVPLIADIHFTPNAAEIAARIVEKVRVNPGNYADKKRFEQIEYTDQAYEAEISRIYERFSPLVKICREYGTAMRIGANHGSLSDRILSRYGDTPLGMVESAMEFVRVCEDHGYHNLVISMKASNPQVMVQAYRLLMQTMLNRGRVYPLHLGVTEAGEGEDGRIKSALGIATLLMDGIGDTVRVSLTEDPEFEAPVADFLVRHFVDAPAYLERHAGARPAQDAPGLPLPIDPFSFNRRPSKALLNLGGGQVPRVVCDLQHAAPQPDSLKAIGYQYVPALDKYNFSDIAADFVFLGNQIPPYELPGGLKAVYAFSTWSLLKDDTRSYPCFESPAQFLQAGRRSEALNFVEVDMDTLPELMAALPEFERCAVVMRAHTGTPAYDWRKIAYNLYGSGLPLLARVARLSDWGYYQDAGVPDRVRMRDSAKIQLQVAADLSTLLVDGLLDGIWVEKADEVLLRTAFGALQLARLRITKTEYISCPSCGRTLFDLQETTARIRARTEHLKGVKIGIMGCIVNGPGEMADADYGYVGVGVDKIALYRGKDIVNRAVPTAQAVDLLIGLIREDGRWVEPE